jgi:carboxypeptidase T
MKRLLPALLVVGLLFAAAVPALAAADRLVIRVDVNNRYDRTSVASTGVTILKVYKDFVYVMGSANDLAEIIGLGYTAKIVDAITAFPPADADFHDFAETVAELNQTVSNHPTLAKLYTIGTSLQGRTIWAIKVSDNPALDEGEPVAFVVALHHAREHLTPEMALALVKKLTDEYATNPTIQALVDENEIWIVPMLNPDGAEYDIQGGSYGYWRKNMRDNGDGSTGVDLNRNYSKWFGGPGSSGNPSDETYRGPAAFSEPETQAIRNFFDAHDVSVALSYHTYGELVLYPNNGDYSEVPDTTDRQVFRLMGQQMGNLTGYTDQPGYNLYLSSGEMVDWMYYTHGVFGFTIEMSPDTFYPGDEWIPTAIAENMDAALFLIDCADDPYRIIENQPLSIDPASASLQVGDTQTFSALGGKPPYSFRSTNTAVATVSATTGLVTAKGVGSTQIIVTDSVAHTATANVTVAKAGLCGLTESDSAPLAVLLLVAGALVILRRRK